MRNLQSPSTARKDFSHFMLHDRPICGALLLRMVAVMAVICKELEKLTAQQAAIGLICGKLMS